MEITPIELAPSPYFFVLNYLSCIYEHVCKVRGGGGGGGGYKNAVCQKSLEFFHTTLLRLLKSLSQNQKVGAK